MDTQRTGKRVDTKSYEALVSQSIEDLRAEEDQKAALRKEPDPIGDMPVLKKRWFRLAAVLLVANIALLYYFRFTAQPSVSIEEANRQILAKYGTDADPLRIFKDMTQPVRACTDPRDPLVLGTLDRINMSVRSVVRVKQDPFPASNLLTDGQGVYWCQDPATCLGGW